MKYYYIQSSATADVVLDDRGYPRIFLSKDEAERCITNMCLDNHKIKLFNLKEEEYADR